jgi:hypothetical protein
MSVPTGNSKFNPLKNRSISHAKLRCGTDRWICGFAKATSDGRFGVKSGPTATVRDIQCRGYQVIEFHRWLGARAPRLCDPAEIHFREIGSFGIRAE